MNALFIAIAILSLNSCVQQKNEFTDVRDGKVYKTVKIGNQTWMAENLNYVTANSWEFDNSSTNGDVYGRLYTWEAALTACPSGWHLPSDAEWTILTDDLGGESVANEKMKSTSRWDYNGNGTNSSGFNALPGAPATAVGRSTTLAATVTGGRRARAQVRARGAGTCTTMAAKCTGATTARRTALASVA